MDETYPMWWGLIALVILVGLFIAFRILSDELRKKYGVSDDKIIA